VRDDRLALVVLTHNRCAELCRTLEHAVGAGEAGQIVVVDNGSSDGTAQTVADRFPTVHLVHSAANLGACGRNLGVEATDRPYVAFSDDDCWWEPGSLSRAADALDAHPRLAIITARVLVEPEGREDPTCVRMRRSPLEARDHPGSVVIGFLAGACVIRRSAFLAAGGYDPRLFLGAEESLLALDVLRSGGSIAYLDDLIVHHHPSRERDVATRRRLLVRNALRIAWMRRPIVRALALTRAAVVKARSRGERLRVLLDLVRDLPWVLQRRRVIPDSIEAALRRVEESEIG
jgi:GT2 family glycosyltransferase